VTETTTVTKAEIEMRIRKGLAELAENLGLKTVPRPVIKWDLKGTSTLGQAWGTTKIRLHPEALAKLGEEYVQTALHEAAHVAVSQLRHETDYYARREGQWSAHGAQWKRAMRSIGLRPDRCATVAPGTLTPARTVQRFVVKCACRDHEITKTRLNKLSTYKCKSCGSNLILVGPVK
jgi:predicted SprT family Zn-dependent metalloprotease